ncbi:hypothetical protein LWI29_002107 [Acer saccharum]|uniref:Ubiquitin-like protease family profile domain-containing protein n=1 Tax=Acer saccharum TaxID=4024 RepID=A0AA39T8Z9_ACESA|nr:hypothetical protein LWI29_002107 [Acer saccharum]
MVDPPPPPHPPRSSFMQPPSPMSSQKEPRSKVPLTDVRDQSLHVEQEVAPSGKKAVDANVSTEQEVAPSHKKEVDEEGLLSGDLMVDYNYVLKEDQSLRVRLRSFYCFSPFIDPTRASATNISIQEEKKPDQHIDAYMSLLAKRMELEPNEHRHSYVLLSSEFFTKVKVEWNRIIEADNKVGSSFDALAYEYPVDWIEYGHGNIPGWGQPWWLYTQLLILCCVGEPDGHWSLCKVNLLDRHIGIFVPIGAKKKKNLFERFKQVMPLRQLLSSIMNKCGFFSSRSEKPRGSMFTVGVLSNPKIPQQVDNCSCGVFICKYTETAIVKKADWNWGQKEMADYRKEITFQIYNNSVVYKSPLQM